MLWGCYVWHYWTLNKLLIIWKTKAYYLLFLPEVFVSIISSSCGGDQDLYDLWRRLTPGIWHGTSYIGYKAVIWFYTLTNGDKRLYDPKNHYTVANKLLTCFYSFVKQSTKRLNALKGDLGPRTMKDSLRCRSPIVRGWMEECIIALLKDF